MAALYGDFFWENLLNVLNNGDAQSANSQSGGNTKQRGVESMPNVALLP